MAIKKEAIDATVEATEAAESKTAIEKKKTSKKSSVKEPAGNTDGFCVYLGPNIHGVIQAGTIYSGMKEQAIASLSSAIEKYPLIAALIVPGETLAEDRIKVKTPGNLLHVNYKKLAAGRKSKYKEEI